MTLADKNCYSTGKLFPERPAGIGAVLKGWDLSEREFRSPRKLPVVDFRAMTSDCPHDCFHCFTDKRERTLTLKEIKNVICQLAEIGCHAINYLGEGEPTLDENFFEIIKHTVSNGIQPVVFTEAATMLRGPSFVRALYKTGASVCPKCDSLWNADYQNWVVGDKAGKYFRQRNEAIKLLAKEGFNKAVHGGTTRLGFDMVVSRKNMNEVARTLRYCRNNNLWIVFSFFLPSGRSKMADFDKSLMLSEDERIRLRETVLKIDLDEYGFRHTACNNFATTHCVEFMQIYGNGNVSPCLGNETIIGNVKTHSIRRLRKMILDNFPVHNRQSFDGNCPYRPNP